jgi:hypothetical protein
VFGGFQSSLFIYLNNTFVQTDVRNSRFKTILLKGRAALKSPKTNTSSNTIEYMDLS